MKALLSLLRATACPSPYRWSDQPGKNRETIVHSWVNDGTPPAVKHLRRRRHRRHEIQVLPPSLAQLRAREISRRRFGSRPRVASRCMEMGSAEMCRRLLSRSEAPVGDERRIDISAFTFSERHADCGRQIQQCSNSCESQWHLRCVKEILAQCSQLDPRARRQPEPPRRVVLRRRQ
jgi:hypothetical protein